MIADAVVVQPLLSISVITDVPAHKPVAVGRVCPLSHKYVYGDVPPEGVTVACPLQKPLQLALVVELIVATRGGG